mgnify:CR=1 FL=1
MKRIMVVGAAIEQLPGIIKAKQMVLEGKIKNGLAVMGILAACQIKGIN